MSKIEKALEILKREGYIVKHDGGWGAYEVWDSNHEPINYGGQAMESDELVDFVETDIEPIWVDEECWDCGEIVNSPTISISIEFKNGEDYNELTDLDYGDDVEKYVNELIEENEWTDVKEWDYGLFCPYCLQSVS